MTFKMIHQNFNVFDLEKSLRFYEEALGLRVARAKDAPDGSWKIRFLESPASDFQLELTWMRSYERPYDLGDAEFHLAFRADDYAAAHALHERMGCIALENPGMGVYFITDPDGYWLEIIPVRDGAKG